MVHSKGRGKGRTREEGDCRGEGGRGIFNSNYEKKPRGKGKEEEGVVLLFSFVGHLSVLAKVEEKLEEEEQQRRRRQQRE